MAIKSGIGLESVADFVSNETFLQAMSLDAHERAVGSMKARRFFSRRYVTVRLPFLNEAKTLSDSIRTATNAFPAGAGAFGERPRRLRDGLSRAVFARPRGPECERHDEGTVVFLKGVKG